MFNVYNDSHTALNTIHFKRPLNIGERDDGNIFI